MEVDAIELEDSEREKPPPLPPHAAMRFRRFRFSREGIGGGMLDLAGLPSSAGELDRVACEPRVGSSGGNIDPVIFLDDPLAASDKPLLTPLRGGNVGGRDEDAVMADEDGSISIGSPIGDFDFDLAAGVTLARRSHFGLALANGFRGNGAAGDSMEDRGVSEEFLEEGRNGDETEVLWSEDTIGTVTERREARLLL